MSVCLAASRPSYGINLWRNLRNAPSETVLPKAHFDNAWNLLTTSSDESRRPSFSSGIRSFVLSHYSASCSYAWSCFSFSLNCGRLPPAAPTDAVHTERFACKPMALMPHLRKSEFLGLWLWRRRRDPHGLQLLDGGFKTLSLAFSQDASNN